MKSFDRAFWLNYFTLQKKIADLEQHSDEYSTALRRVDSANEKLIKKRLETSIKYKFFSKKWPGKIETLEIHLGKMNNKKFNFEELEEKIRKDLRNLWEGYLVYVEKKVPEMKKEMKKFEPISGKDAIKKLLEEMFENDKSIKDKISKLYKDEDVNFPKIEELEEFDLYLKYIPKIFFDEYDNCFCHFKNPMEKQSFTKMY